MGEFTAITRHKDIPLSFRLFVIDTETDNLLSRSVASHIGGVKKNVDSLGSVPWPLTTIETPVKCKPVKISLHDDAEPYSLNTARRIVIPLIEKGDPSKERTT